MTSGSGAKMQCTSYLPGYYSTVDHNAAASGSLWQLLNNGVTYESRMAFSVLLEPCSSHLYNKEMLRQTMLQHECIFRNQVQELHNLYMRQRQLMDELQMRKASQYNLQMQTSGPNLVSSQMQCTISQKALESRGGLFLNHGDSKPSAPGVMNFQGPSTCISKKSMQAGSDSFLGRNCLEENKVSSLKSPNSRKRMLDLELPAEDYVDSEEEEQERLGVENSVVVSQVGYDPYKSNLETPPKINLELSEGPSNFNSSCCKSSYLFDLNESVQLNESATPNSTSLVDSNASSMDFTHQDQDLSGKTTSKSPVLDEEISYNILETKGNEGSSITSGLQLCFTGISPLSCDDRTSMWQEYAKTRNELMDDNHQTLFSSCRSNSYLLVPSPVEANTEASNSVSCQQMSFRYSREIPIAIQALPCFNSPEFLQKSRSPPSSSAIKGKYAHLTRNPASSLSPGSIITCITSNSHGKSGAEDHPVTKSRKDLDHGKTFLVMDLNVMRQSRLPVSEENIRSINGENLLEDSLGQFGSSRVDSDSDGQFGRSPNSSKTQDLGNQFRALTSNASLTKSPKDKDILISEKTRKISSSLANKSSEESKTCNKDDFITSNKIDDSLREHPISTAATQMIDKMEIGTKLEAPISLDSQNKSPPRDESEDNKIEIPLHISDQKTGDPHEDFSRIAAETIISISFSGVQECLKTANSYFLEASNECLNWFAGIVSSVTGDTEDEFERLLEDAPGVDDNILAPGRNGLLRASKVEDHCYETTKQKYKKIPGTLCPIQREAGQARKARQEEKFQSRLASPCNVTKNLLPIKRSIIAAGDTPRTVTSRKKVRRNGHARGSRQSKAFYANLTERRVCSLLKQHTCKTECSFVMTCLQNGWGKRSRRGEYLWIELLIMRNWNIGTSDMLLNPDKIFENSRHGNEL